MVFFSFKYCQTLFTHKEHRNDKLVHQQKYKIALNEATTIVTNTDCNDTVEQFISIKRIIRSIRIGNKTRNIPAGLKCLLHIKANPKPRPINPQYNQIKRIAAIRVEQPGKSKIFDAGINVNKPKQP